MRFRRRRGRAEPRIEITPLIDVIFQLLIFFLLTSRFITEQSLDVELPQAGPASEARERRTVTVLDVDREGRVFHDGGPVGDGALDGLLRRAAAASERPVLLLRADRAVEHGRVVDVMDRARAFGIAELAIATRPRDGPEPAR
jgi:biopolymer transport protein ExbD